MDWLYRLTANANYPDPAEEIDALCTLDAEGCETFLLLANSESPPLSGASAGEIVGVCTSANGRLVLHATTVVAGGCYRGATPASVRAIYGDLQGRVFARLGEWDRVPCHPLPESVLSLAGQATFLKGQAFVKRLGTRPRTPRRATPSPPNVGSPHASLPAIPTVHLPKRLPAFTVVGLDPTAGTWTSRMTSGTKPMPSFALRWTGERFQPDARPLATHFSNDEFFSEVRRRSARLVCIDGPCATNGPGFLPDRSGWDSTAPSGTRGGEVALSRQGVSLFWTTRNTVTHFEGASRWIARSLVLFAETPAEKIETHPHGAFTFLWRAFGGQEVLPKKLRPGGREARLALLRAFIPDLADDMLPDHDAVDAACAALVAGLHSLELTVAFGTPGDGGQIWMPDVTKLAGLISARAA